MNPLFPARLGPAPEPLKNANDRVDIFLFSMSSRLLALSPELHLSIISYLPLFDKRRLRLACQLFDNLLDVPFRDLRTAKQKQNRSKQFSSPKMLKKENSDSNRSLS
jgi:hypothetical protein